MGKTRPLMNYLLTATSNSLQSFELAHLNASSNIRKTLFQILAQYVEEEANAQLARWVNDYQRAASLTPAPVPGNLCHVQLPAIFLSNARYASHAESYEAAQTSEKAEPCFDFSMGNSFGKSRIQSSMLEARLPRPLRIASEPSSLRRLNRSD